MTIIKTLSDVKKNYEFDVNRVHEKARESTNLLIDQCYAFYDSSLFDFSVPASRNVYQSEVYHNFYALYMMTEVWRFHNVCVLVESYALYIELKKVAAKYHKNNCVKINVARYLKHAFKPFARLIISTSRMLHIKIQASKFGLTAEKLIQEKDLIFIDTNLAEGFFSSKGYVDRYYGALFDLLTHDEKRNIVIVPNYSAAGNFDVIRKEYQDYSASSGVRVFNKESILSLFDYVLIIGKSILSMLLCFKKNPNSHSSFVREELFLKAFSKMSYEALVSYVFFKSEFVKKLNIKMFLLWYENHIYDKAYFRAYNESKLKFKFKAYQPLLDENYEFFIEPTPIEIERNLVPLIRLKTGESEIPLFRLARYIDYTSKYAYVYKQQNRVLVALSLIPRLCDEVMKTVAMIAAANPTYSFVVRCHPLLRWPLPNEIQNISYDEDSDIVLSLKKSHIFIGTGSVTVLEAAIVGLPVVIVQSSGEPIQCHLPIDYQSSMLTVIGTTTDLSNILDRVLVNAELNKEKINKASQDLYKKFIEPINKNNVLGMLN